MLGRDRVGANSDSDTDYHPKSLSIPTSSQPGRARASGRSTQGGTLAAETGWADTPLVRASALHGRVPARGGGSHLGSSLSPRGAVLTGPSFDVRGQWPVSVQTPHLTRCLKKCCTPRSREVNPHLRQLPILDEFFMPLPKPLLRAGWSSCMHPCCHVASECFPFSVSYQWRCWTSSLQERRSLPNASPTPTGPPSIRNIPRDEPASASTTDH